MFKVTVMNPKPWSIHRMVAYDRDEGPNAEVTYMLKGSQTSQFYINSTTGEVFSRKDLSPGEVFDVTVSGQSHDVVHA